jgi:hypothetical protein
MYITIKNNICKFIEKNNIIDTIYSKTKKYTINNKFSMFSENALSVYSALSKIDTKILVFLPIFFFNYMCINFYIKRVLNALFIVYIYNNRNYYINKILDCIFYSKIFTDSIYLKYFKKEKKEFVLDKVLLYTDLTKNYDITSYFNTIYFSEINKSVFDNICIRNNIDISDNNDDLRLKLYFTYKDIKYILYFSYNNNSYIPYPPYSFEIMRNYRLNIVLPGYSNKKKIYSLFNIDSKNISYIYVNNIQNDVIVNYINQIRTPFNDFGLLYNPVKLSWLLYENSIDITTFNSFTLKFLNLYFDEVKMDLIEHYIKIDNSDLNKIIISDRMKEILF